MSITDKKDDSEEKTSTSEETTEDTTEESPSTESTDSGESAEETTDEESTSEEQPDEPPKRKATPEESRSYYEKLREERTNEAKDKVAKYERMEEIRKTVAANPNAIGGYLSTDYSLLEEMVKYDDTVWNAYQKYQGTNPQAPPSIEKQGLTKEDLQSFYKEQRESEMRQDVFDQMNKDYPGFKGSKLEREIIEDLGGIDVIDSFSPDKLDKLLRKLYKASVNDTSDSDLAKDATMNQSGNFVPGASSKSKRGIVLKGHDKAVYEEAKRMNPKLTVEKFLQLG